MTAELRQILNNEAQKIVEAGGSSFVFLHGVKTYFKNLWHDASEEPIMNAMIIYKCNGCVPDIGRFFGIACTEGHSTWDIFKFPNRSLIENIEKWCYLDDILPDNK